MNRSSIWHKTRGFAISGEWLSVFLIIVMVVVLGFNLVRAIVDANKNYQVYLSEKESLALIQRENNKLKNELLYYTSFEYKKLYARDNLRLAEPGEKLYRIIGNEVYYQVGEKRITVHREQNKLHWWLMMLN